MMFRVSFGGMGRCGNLVFLRRFSYLSAFFMFCTALDFLSSEIMVGLYGIGSVWMCSDRSAGNEGRNFISNLIIFITSILNYGKKG